MSAVSEKPVFTYKNEPFSVSNFQESFLAMLRRLPTNFTLEDFEKAFRSSSLGETFHYKDLRSVLLAVPTILEKGGTFSYVPSGPNYDGLGLQKLEDEIYEVAKDIRAPFPARAISTAYFERYWDRIHFAKFGFESENQGFLRHPALAVTWYGYFYIRASFKKESEKRKEKKLKALQARISAVVSTLSMPFIAKGMESAYEKRFKEKILPPAEFGYESLLELLKNHPALEEVVAPDFIDVVCFKLKNIHSQTVSSAPNKRNWLLSEIEATTSARSQLFALKAVIDRSWEEFFPQILQFLRERRSYKVFEVDGEQWLYKLGEDERNALDVDSEGRTDEKNRNEQMGRVIRFLGGGTSVSILQRTFYAMFKRAISIADIIDMVSSNSNDYRISEIERYKKDFVVHDKRLHGNNGVEENVRCFVRCFTQAISDCGGDASLSEVLKRWEFISGCDVNHWDWKRTIFQCDSMQELREKLSDEILIFEAPKQELRFQNKTPLVRTEMEEGTLRLLEILNECEKGKKLSHYELFDKYMMKYGMGFNFNELWRYFEVTKAIHLRPLLAKTPIRVFGKTQWEFRIWLQEENDEDGAKDDVGEVDAPRRAVKRKAEEPMEQAAKKKVADVVTETEDNADEGCSVVTKETVDDAPVSKPLENEMEDLHSEKNTTKFREEAVQTEPSVPPSIPTGTSSSVSPPLEGIPSTPKHAPLGNLIAKMLDYAEHKGKNAEELFLKIVDMIAEDCE